VVCVCVCVGGVCVCVCVCVGGVCVFLRTLQHTHINMDKSSQFR